MEWLRVSDRHRYFRAGKYSVAILMVDSINDECEQNRNPNENNNLRISVVFLAAATMAFGTWIRIVPIGSKIIRRNSTLSQTDIKHYQNVIAFNKIEIKERKKKKTISESREIGRQAKKRNIFDPIVNDRMRRVIKNSLKWNKRSESRQHAYEATTGRKKKWRNTHKIKWVNAKKDKSNLK